ncbi:MAG: hypothetical protein ACK5RL_10505 [Acidimicrobiales bacterium]
MPTPLDYASLVEAELEHLDEGLRRALLGEMFNAVAVAERYWPDLPMTISARPDIRIVDGVILMADGARRFSVALQVLDGADGPTLMWVDFLIDLD